MACQLGLRPHCWHPIWVLVCIADVPVQTGSLLMYLGKQWKMARPGAPVLKTDNWKGFHAPGFKSA